MSENGKTTPFHATALVVDDDEMVRRMTCQMLVKLGLRVIEAARGNEALERISLAKQGEIDVVLTDMMMPGMGGCELVAAIRQCQPAIKILMISGMAEPEAADPLPGDAAFLQKPYRLQALSEKLHGLLAGLPA